MSLIVSSLRARLAMRTGTSALRTRRLIERLEDTAPGNPTWRFSWENPVDCQERITAVKPDLPGGPLSR